MMEAEWTPRRAVALCRNVPLVLFVGLSPLLVRSDHIPATARCNVSADRRSVWRTGALPAQVSELSARRAEGAMSVGEHGAREAEAQRLRLNG